MTRGSTVHPYRVRVIIIASLALCAASLLGIERFDLSRPRPLSPAQERETDAMLAAAVDTALARYGVDRSGVKTWRAMAAGRPTGRVESRAPVSPEFLSLQFNHDLNVMLEQLEARVIATERTRENSVTMHIVRGGTTVRSITLVTDTGLRRP